MSAPTLPQPLAAWERGGRYVELGSHRVFVVERGEGPETLLVLHGFPTSSFDYAGVIDRLAQRYRVIVHDHLGFGLSAKPSDHAYSLFEQADLAVQLWWTLGVTDAHLVAHDYGTSVATEVLARRERGLLPFNLRSLSLCNGSVHLELARLTWPQKLMKSPTWGPLFVRVATERLFRRRLIKTLARREAFSNSDLAAHWAALEHGGGRLLLPKISGYLDERVRFAGRWIGALTRLDIPAHVIWGKSDPISVAAIGERLAEEIPGARLTLLDEVGHFPMVEAPEAWLDAVTSTAAA